MSELQIDQPVGCNNTIFIFHVGARSQLDAAAGGFNQYPSGRDIPQADALLDVSVEASAGNVSHVERGAAEYATFAHLMNHLLKQRKIRVNHLASLGKADRDDGLGQIGTIADAKMRHED